MASTHSTQYGVNRHGHGWARRRQPPVRTGESCGLGDTSDLCNPIFGKQSQDLIETFTYLQLPGCGHDVLGCGVPVQKERLESAIVKHIQDAKVHGWATAALLLLLCCDRR